jgi:hypothetical protein
MIPQLICLRLSDQAPFNYMKRVSFGINFNTNHKEMLKTFS